MSNSTKLSYFKQLPLRTLVFIFFVLSVLVFTDTFVALSAGPLFILEVSMRVKTDVSNAFRNILNFERLNALNSTVNGTLRMNTSSSEDRLSDASLKLIINNEGRIQRLNKTDDDMANNVSFPDSNSGQAEAVQEVKRATVQYNILGNPVIKGATDNQRKDICNNCFKHDFSYVIDNPDICSLHSDKEGIELLIIVLTVHTNLLQRNTLRQTWLTYSKNNTTNIRYAFLLGEVNDPKLREDIVKESHQFRDIIKEDFVDTYSNLTYKTIMGFKWASTKCTAAKAVLKTDDDMYINIPNVLNIIRNNINVLQTNVVGSCAQTAGPIRNAKSKWFASVNSYPGKFYPGFCSGTGYLTSLSVAQKVYEISPNVPFFHLEDVYVSLCIKKIGYHLKGFPGFNPGHPILDPCVYNGNTLVTAHYMTPAMTKLMWNSRCNRGPVKSSL